MHRIAGIGLNRYAAAMERLDVSIRRQILKDDESIVGQPLELFGAGIGRSVQANTRHLALILLDSEAKERASRAAAYIENLADISSEKYVTALVACAKGCSHCCTTYGNQSTHSTSAQRSQ